MVFLQTYSVGTRLIIESKNRLGATALANQKMEIIRSINYDAIGTTSGVPAGDLAENETISVNTVKYEVHTFVQYVDDSFDATVSTGDAIPTDYKRVRLTVSWGNLGSDQSVILFGNFSPNGVEVSSGGGVLSINILDGNGSGVSGASVHIVNGAAGVDTTGSTDSTGNLTLPGTPVGIEAYVLTVSKNGYYGATTYPAYPTTAYEPVDVHASVAADVLNQKTMVMDQSSDMTLTTKDPFGTAVPAIGYTLKGGRLLGTDPVTFEDTFGFSQSGTTDGSGVASYADESAGQYVVTISGANYEFYKMSPEGVIANEFSALAGVATDMTAVLLDKNIGSVKVKVQNQADLTALSGASVHMTNAVLLYDATVVTDQYGYAYFPTALPALVAGTYDITVSLSGYTDETDTATVGTALVTKTIQMSP
ncbi:MAG: carboxypeptidase-like regulatory domain-containing protein [Candidatus Moraniibacteriota bacterium]